MSKRVILGTTYRHYKGGRYMPLGIVKNSERREQKLVVYISLDKAIAWARPLETPGEDSWNDVVPWPDGKERKRFVPSFEIPKEELDHLTTIWAITEAMKTES